MTQEAERLAKELAEKILKSKETMRAISLWNGYETKADYDNAESCLTAIIMEATP